MNEVDSIIRRRHYTLGNGKTRAEDDLVGIRKRKTSFGVVTSEIMVESGLLSEVSSTMVQRGFCITNSAIAASFVGVAGRCRRELGFDCAASFSPGMLRS